LSGINIALPPAATFFFSRQRLLTQIALWRTHLPYVTPHYAVKSNNDSTLLQWLHKEGVRFDCASPREMQQVLVTGARPSHIVYAHPCKSTNDVREAQGLGVPNTVVDSPEEVIKLAEGGWKGGVLVRLMVPDSGSAIPFSKKFGAPIGWVPDILTALKAAGLRHMGWSFHVGSLCTQPNQFRTAIELCAAASADNKAPAAIVDIGGGFIPDAAQFKAAAAEITASMRLFHPTTQWIAEPGRFMSAPVVELQVQVIGVKRRTDGSGWRYTIDESIYGAFSNIPFDGQRPVYTLLDPEAEKRPRVRATLFGRTCDSADCLAEDMELPELRVGDWLSVQNMGSYTLVSASEFNGFPQPTCRYEENGCLQ
jgi:ornithine decarboxylase